MNDAAKEIIAHAARVGVAQNQWRLCYHTAEDELVVVCWQQFCREQLEIAQLSGARTYFEEVFYSQLQEDAG